MDVICQAKSGMGKTAVFVLTVLQQLEPEEGKVSAIVLCHTRELAFQVRWELPRALQPAGYGLLSAFLPSKRDPLI